MNYLKYAQVHRFNDRVALGTRSAKDERGPTVYITALDARRIGEWLIACADDIRDVESFAESRVTSKSLDACDLGLQK